MKETTIKVQGMTCQHCVKAVSGALIKLPGVKDAQVNLEKGEVTVSYDDGLVNVQAMKDAIEGQGYDLG